jgi:hypothetical protein
VDLDLVDECFIRASPDAVSATFHEPRHWAGWWPGLTLAVYQDRGAEGLRWRASGTLTGSLEVWLEPFGDGVIVHHYVRAELAGRSSTRRLLRERRRHAQAWKRAMWQLKDDLEAARERTAAESA